MKVSVIVPTYNEEENITACLTSLQNQSLRGLEVIVVDDGSDDRTLQVLSKFQVTDIKLQILKQKHRGAGAARNLGAKKATGEILVFVDADMTFDKYFISDLIKPITERKTIGTFSKNEMLANKSNLWAVSWNLNRGLPKNRMHPEDYPDKQPVFRAVLKSEFVRVGGFNEKAGYTDDWSLSERLGVEAHVASGAVFYHQNPDTLKEVFIQSKWMAKRKYKLGLLGLVVALFRVSLPISIIWGSVLAIRHKLPSFVFFKTISDLGQFLGILEYQILKKVSK